MNKLQPLRIQTGWKVCFNAFIEMDPQELIDDDDENWWEFNEDLLQLENSDKNLILDLGWYGERNLKSGFFKINLIHNLNWDNPLVEFISKKKDEIIDKIEEYMKSY
jgi:hypothetical protein